MAFAAAQAVWRLRLRRKPCGVCGAHRVLTVQWRSSENVAIFGQPGLLRKPSGACAFYEM
jgi:hypothetical protein